MTEQPDPGPATDPLDISGWSEEHQRHVRALGLIAELTAQLDNVGRWMLGLAMGTTDYDLVDDLFLGERFGSLATRLHALAKRKPDSEFLAEAVKWAAGAKKLVDERDVLMHRVVDVDVDLGLSKHAYLMPARRSQNLERLNGRSVKLVVDLQHAIDCGVDIAGRYTIAVGQANGTWPTGD